jgi:hypothetical protein
VLVETAAWDTVEAAVVADTDDAIATEADDDCPNPPPNP